MADNDPAIDDMFAGMKKKKKSKKVVFDEEEAAAPTSAPEPVAPTPAPAPAVETAVEPTPTPAVPTAAAPADLSEPTIPDDLDFSDLKKKKKKKVKIALSDDEDDSAAAPSSKSSGPKVDALGNAIEDAPTVEGEATTGGEGGDGEGAGDDDEFANLKKMKKKKSKKAAFDMEAFEKDLAEADAAKAGSGAEEDDAGADVGGDEGLEGEDPFANEGEGATMSKAEKAAEAKLWLKEGDRDYHYEELLGRFYSQLYASHPSLSAHGVKRKQTLAPPQMYRDGNKRSVFANVVDICKKMHRSPEHVIQFLFAELGTSGSVDAAGRLVIKGRFQQKQLENVLRRYIMEYVACRTCKSPDTLLTKDNRLFFVTCNSCGSKRTVQAIKTGFAAQIGKRKAQKTG